MLSKSLQSAINAQINAEYWSAYLYLSMSLDAQTKNLNGIANWFYIQWLEEQDHARILEQYLGVRDARVELQPIGSVPPAWPDVRAMFSDTLQHEQEVTAMIVDLMSIARQEKDYASMGRLQWFIDEQMEEEQSARDILARIDMYGSDRLSLYILDHDLGQRQYTPAEPLDK